MGCNCCKRGHFLLRNPAALNPEDASYNSGHGLPQILFIGPTGSGKTTLMYSTVIPGWSTVISAMEPTVAFHYEQVSRHNIQFGMWDVSGSAESFWPIFYRNIAFDGLIFVISVYDANLHLSKEWIRKVLNEDALRLAQIVVVLNTFSDDYSEKDGMVGHPVSSGLGLHDLATLIDFPQRLSWVLVNAKNGERDPNWASVISNFIHRMQLKYGVVAADERSTECAASKNPNSQLLGDNAD